MVMVPERLEDRAIVYDHFNSHRTMSTEKERRIAEKSGIRAVLETNYQKLRDSIERKVAKNSEDLITTIGEAIIIGLEIEEDQTQYSTLERTCRNILTEVEREYSETLREVPLKHYRRRMVFGIARVIMAKMFVGLYLDREK